MTSGSAAKPQIIPSANSGSAGAGRSGKVQMQAKPRDMALRHLEVNLVAARVADGNLMQQLIELRGTRGSVLQQQPVTQHVGLARR